jgi:hypothetical protein
LPTAALLLSSAFVLVPMVRMFFHAKAAARTPATYAMATERYEIVIPADHLLRFVFNEKAFQMQGPITCLNVPGQFLQVLVSRAITQDTSNWYPATLGRAVWRVISFPFFALPAWFFVGRGIDALFQKTRVNKLEMVVSLTLSILFLVLGIGLRFGLTDAERADQDLLNSYIAGFVLWAILIGIPFSAWLRQTFMTAQAIGDEPL